MEVVQPANPLSIYGDNELLELTAMKDDPELSHQAFTEFYKRFSGIIYQSIYFLCQTLPNQEEMTGIVFNNTFYNAYRYAHSFLVEDTRETEIIKKRVIGWLLQIAKTDLKGQFLSIKKEKENKEKDEAAYAAMQIKASAAPMRETYNEQIVRKAIAQIPKERDREIFWLYWLFYDQGPKGQVRKLPNNVAEGLACKFNTTDVNIRQIISRSNKIVKKYLIEHYKK